MEPIQLVWFSRDLRWQDHTPLAEAARRGPVVCLYVFEQAALATDALDGAHHRFVVQSLEQLDSALRERGIQLTIRVGDFPDVLDEIRQEVPVAALHSHHHVDGLIGQSRDKRIRWWCEDQGIPWHRTAADGVRRKHSAAPWRAQWLEVMETPQQHAPAQLVGPRLRSDGVPEASELGLEETERGRPFVGGAEVGQQVLHSWLTDRALGLEEHEHLVAQAWERSSRLSPWLAWGCLSMRQVYQATQQALQERSSQPAWQHSLRTFSSRLPLRAEALQQLADEPNLQFRSMNRGLDDLRPPHDRVLLANWRDGYTGYPLIDAAQRSLLETGWMPYNLRRLTVQFACFHLWQPWRAVAAELGRLFIDFEPGIHYPQIQVLTGGSPQPDIEIPNPTRMAQQLDPDGAFIRRWVPELSEVGDRYIHNPWRMGGMAQRQSGCRIGRDYPEPVVHHATVYKQAKRRLRAAVNREHVTADTRRVEALHGSRPGRLASVRPL